MRNNKSIIIILLIGVLFTSCKKNKSKKRIVNESSKSVKSNTEELNLKTINYQGDKKLLKSYYQLEHIKEFYEIEEKEFFLPPTLNYNQDLTKLSYEDLRLLRNEVFARNGYLFKNGFLRGYFNQFNWYKPIFDVPSFKIEFNDEEKEFISKIKTEEKLRKKEKIILKKNLNLYNTDLIVNKKQFSKIPKKILRDFENQNFSIIKADREMPFFTYDENAYQFIPHYITTDLYLFILHKYFSRSLEKLDENYMYNTLLEILKETNKKLKELPKRNNKSIIEWSEMYNAMALYTMGDNTIKVPERYKVTFEGEKQQIINEKGKPLFILNQFVDYSELIPRGHYTKSKKLKQYFKTFKWISLNGINLNKDEELKGLMLFAYIIKSNKKIYNKYKDYLSIIEKLAGKEDNLSLGEIVNMIESNTVEELLSEQNVQIIKEKLKKIKKERIKIVLGKDFNTEEREIQRVYFLSSTYSISGEIFSKLIHVNGKESKRTFPKGLDIPAVFGNETAENILLKEYKDNENWSEYLPKLKSLQNQFNKFNEWDHNYGFKGLKTALDASAEQDNYPDFMKTEAYNRKELSTTLASWTHIKHDLILYQEKPFAAEGGQGGGPEPPQHFSYVEPNLKFWDTALELVDWLEELSIKEATYEDELIAIKKIGKKLRKVANKQIEGEEITKKEYSDLHFIGGTIEYILLGLLETDHIPERERSMALIADVYKYNSTNLNIAVGHADDIYTIVPFKNEYYIARGSIFSYYEFTGKIYTDKQWKEKIKNKELPERPKWLQPIINNIPNLKGQMEYRYEGTGYYD